MSSTLEEFQDILNAETSIDIDRLRELAKHGVPDRIRGTVWKYLLGSEKLDRCTELSDTKAKYEDYLQYEKENSEISKSVRGEVSRYTRARAKKASFFNANTLPRVLTNVISAYINHNGALMEADSNMSVEFGGGLVHLCGPLVYILNDESEIYWTFERLMNVLANDFSRISLAARTSQLLTLFRSFLPDLYSHFEDEEVAQGWATSWSKYLLAKELPIECTMRLWDTFFSTEEGLDFHPFVCLAILREIRESVEELEQSEIMAYLNHLPVLDMDQIIAQAFDIRLEVLESRRDFL